MFKSVIFISIFFSAIANSKQVDCVQELKAKGLNPSEQLQVVNPNSGSAYLKLGSCAPKIFGDVLVDSKGEVSLKYSRKKEVAIGEADSTTGFISLYSDFEIESANYKETKVAKSNNGLKSLMSCLFFDICGTTRTYTGFQKYEQTINIKIVPGKRSGWNGYRLSQSIQINPLTNESKKNYNSIQYSFIRK
jgi:hypothetical protein